MAIHMSRIDELALITLDRPEALNALSFGQLHDLGRMIDSIADSDARALLVTGAGERAFSAGADIKELMDRTLVEQRAGAMLGQSVLAKLDRLSMPSIALINGYAFGGGLELALACTSAWRRRPPSSVFPRSNSGSSQDMAGHIVCRG
jgi:enoyl-CoA hydratase